MKKIVKLSLALVLIASVSFAQSKKPTSGPLDKKTFTVDITIDGKKKAEPTKDELKFDKGKFNCKLFAEEGFIKPEVYEASYDSSAKPVTCSITVEAKDESGKTFKWDGTITFGDEVAIEGTAAIIDKKGKQKKSWTYTGALKGKKAPAKK